MKGSRAGGVALCLLGVWECAAQQRAVPPIKDRIAGMEKQDGFFPTYWDSRTGKLWLEAGRWGQEFLYVNSLAAGVGSNDIGLDRGQLGRTRIVRFERVGPKVLLIQSNYSYRANSRNPDEQRAVRESFAESVLWGGDVDAEEGGRALVDATSLFLRDAHDVAGSLRRANQGTWRLDNARSAFYLERTKNFPKNTEVEVTLTFAGDAPGFFVREVVPTPDAITVRQHHSLIELPESGYTPRAFDPRAGYFGGQYMDYSAPVAEPVVQRFIARHRLSKRDPRAPVSEPVKPIVYYVDRGAPEPIRTALVEGARWWNQAFEAAGYKDAFRVELLPEGADPMDVRYNVVQWVHRSTRGWSYGSTVSDPRTGEIIKGKVTLGSLRVRQDFLIAEGLLAPYETGKPASPDMERMALARLRQLSAHEVGHTLGLSHNFVASATGQASVMDYPHPYAKLNDAGVPDLSHAYATGIGAWDKVAVVYGYQDVVPGEDEKQALDGVLRAANARGLYFLTDADARPPGSAHPQNHLWDNGTNAVDELERVMNVRRKALDRFSENNIREGAPMGTLEDTLVVVYLSHRYQVEAAAKSLGGLIYRYALRGDGQPVAALLSGPEQRRALEALLKTIAAGELALPERMLALLPPRPPGYSRTRESFRGRTGITFDALAPAESAASITIAMLLDAQRAARLVQYAARDRTLPPLEEVIRRLVEVSWKTPRKPGLPGETQRAVDMVALRHLMGLAADERAAPAVRAITARQMESLKAWLKAAVETDSTQRALNAFAASEIERFQKDPKQYALPPAIEPPPGMPIGTDWCEWEGAAN